MRTGRPTGQSPSSVSDGGRAWVEYPPGKIIYEPRNAMYGVRLSPDGALVAVMEQEVFGGGAEWLTIIDRNGAIVKIPEARGNRGGQPRMDAGWK